MSKNIFIKIAGAVAFAWMLTSCLDSEVDLTGIGDAYILVEMNGQDTVKGLGLHAFSYVEFKSVSVSVTGNAALKYTLDPYLTYKQDFIWSTPSGQYVKTLPAAGEYIFSAIFVDNQTLEFYDRLTSEFILPPPIKNCTFNVLSKVAEVEWEKVKLADAYNVKLLDQSGKILFVSPTYNNATTIYTFGSSTQGWQTGVTVPADGQKVTVEVTAYLMEALKEQNELQCIAKSRSEITWKQ